MAVTSQEIKMLACDVEDCEVSAPAVDRKLPAKFESGFVDLGTLEDEPARWVACRKTHITGAVLAAKAKALAELTPGDEPIAPEAAGSQPGDTEPVRGDDDADDDGVDNVDENERRRRDEADLDAMSA